jgi:hypothetical protein
VRNSPYNLQCNLERAEEWPKNQNGVGPASPVAATAARHLLLLLGFDPAARRI